MSKMSTREMMDKAAKMAGVLICDWDMLGTPIYRGPFFEKTGRHIWDPLNDDGDAFRLAVQLDMTDLYYSTDDWELCNHDGFAATRRAIVRKAAEMWIG